MLAPGSVLQSRYRIIKTLGVGGMGAVYLAQDMRLANRPVAVKEMMPDPGASLAEQAQAEQLFQQEASLLASLDHPNLPRVYDYFSEANNQYLVMDYVDGETLEEILNGTPGFLPEGQVLNWAAQLCDVLTYLHGRQPPVIFRDLKPGNIMVDRSGEAKLIDFGIARLFKPGKPTDTLKMGTTGYAPPEQYAGKGQTDVRSDIYSLGATLHHLLTKRDPTQYPPFSFDTAPPRGLNPAISPHVEAAITRALAYDHAQRFQSALEMKQALLSPAPRRGSVQRIRPFLLIAAVVLLVVMALTVTDGWGKFLRPAPTPGPVIMTTPTTPPATATPMPATQVPPTPGRSVSVPTDTPSLQPPTPTATSRPADTPTPEPVAVVAFDTLNVRGGPGTDYEIVAKVYRGDRLTIEGRDQAGTWFEVAIPDSGSGWVSREYVNTSAAITPIPVIQVTPVPTCRLTVEPQLAAAWDRGKLGCPTDGANIIWAAWQPFERGYMFWRYDTMRVIVFYNDDTWTEFTDQWDGFTTVSPGNPPLGRVAPLRGFGYLWSTYDEIATRLGWGLEDEKGFCADIQPFERGLIFRSSTVSYCHQDKLYNHATDPAFKPLFFAVYGDGTWRRY